MTRPCPCPTLSMKTTKTLKLSSRLIALTKRSSGQSRLHPVSKCEQRNQRQKQRHKVLGRKQSGLSFTYSFSTTSESDRIDQVNAGNG